MRRLEPTPVKPRLLFLVHARAAQATPRAAADTTYPAPTVAHRPLAGFWRRMNLGLERLLQLRVVCQAALALWVFLLLPRSIQDPDIWWHLRNAAMQLHAHALLARDAYAWTTVGAPWINHEWLAELPLYLGWRLAGPAGLYAVTLVSLEFIFLSLFSLALRRSGNLPASLFATVVAAFLSTVSFGPRTLLFGWALLLIELFILEAFPRRPSVLFALPPLFALWVNLHGSWLIGMVVSGAYFVCGLRSFHCGGICAKRWSPAQLRIQLAVLALCCLALLLNPYGARLVAYPFDLAFHQRLNIANVQEWQPLNLQSPRGLLFVAVLGALFAAQLVRTRVAARRMWTMHEVAWLSIGTLAALLHGRFLFLGAILVAPLLARELAGIGGSETPRTSVRQRWPVHAALLLAMVFFSDRVAHRNRQPSVQDERFPVAALSFLEGFHPQGRVFNEFLWGGFLDFYTPQIPVFIDSRVDIFERAGVLRDYLDILRMKNSLALLDRYQVRYVLFERDSALIYLLQQTHDWKTAYDDGKVILLERSRGVSTESNLQESAS